MQPLRAHVKNGRLVLDEPTELRGSDTVREVIELVRLDEVLADGGDDLDEEERAAFIVSWRRRLPRRKQVNSSMPTRCSPSCGP